MLKVENLSYTYGKGTSQETVALDDVSFTIEQGELVGIIGHTGSGKTTLVKHFNGLLKPTSGKVFVDGKVGLVFQTPENQFFEATVYDEIAFGARKKGIAEQKISDTINEIAESMGFPMNLLKASPFEISNGEKRRVALASNIITNPSILVLDEPTAGLDADGCKWVTNFVLGLRKTSTVIVVSHDIEFIASLADRVIVLNKGRLIIDAKSEVAFDDVEKLKSVGLAAPQISVFMSQLKGIVPDISTEVVTPKQAANEIYLKIMEKKG